jgi:hypothetical protein
MIAKETKRNIKHLSPFSYNMDLFENTHSYKDIIQTMKTLIVSTFLLLLSVHSYAGDEFAAQKEACKEDVSRTWSTTMNKCIQKSQWVDNLKNYRSCTDKPTKEERDDCLYKLTKEVTGDTDFDDFNSTSEIVMNALTGIVSAINWGMLDSKYSACTSLKMSSICGGAAVAKDFYINYKGKEATEDIKDDFLDKVKDKESYETQVIAYQAQIDQMKSISGFYKQKATAHMVIGTCYMATVAVALYEAVQTADKSCLSQTSDGKGNELTSKEGDGALKDGEIGKLETDQIKANELANDAPQEALGGKSARQFNKDATKHNNEIREGLKEGKFQELQTLKPESLFSLFGESNGAWQQWTGTPGMLAVFNTMNFSWQMYLMKKSNEEADKADFIAKRVDIAKNQFVDGMSQYCPGGHDDKSNLLCYCYEMGKKKSNRTNSRACQDLWASKDRQLFVRSSDKERGSQAKERVGCVNVNGQFDPNCQCRKFKDQQGNNACRKASFSTIGLGGFNEAINVAELQKSLDNISAGVGDPGPLNVSNDTLSAVGDALKRKAISNIKTKDENGKPKPMTLKEFDKLQNSFVEKGKKELAAGKSPTLFGKSLATSSKKAMDDIKKKSPIGKRDKGLQMEGGKGILAKKKKKKDEVVSFNLDSGGNSTVQNFGGSNYMDKTYNTGNADINNRKDVSIFKILTNRYNKSGYRRLFEE